jgi:hypothetical protein
MVEVKTKLESERAGNDVSVEDCYAKVIEVHKARLANPVCRFQFVTSSAKRNGSNSCC